MCCFKAPVDSTGVFASLSGTRGQGHLYRLVRRGMGTRRGDGLWGARLAGGIVGHLAPWWTGSPSLLDGNHGAFWPEGRGALAGGGVRTGSPVQALGGPLVPGTGCGQGHRCVADRVTLARPKAAWLPACSRGPGFPCGRTGSPQLRGPPHTPPPPTPPPTALRSRDPPGSTPPGRQSRKSITWFWQRLLGELVMRSAGAFVSPIQKMLRWDPLGAGGPLRGVRPHTQVRRVYGRVVIRPLAPVGSEGIV